MSAAWIWTHVGRAREYERSEDIVKAVYHGSGNWRFFTKSGNFVDAWDKKAVEVLRVIGIPVDEKGNPTE